MASTASIGQFGALIDPGVRKHFFDAYTQEEPQLDQVFQVMTQTDFNEKHQQYAGLGGMSTVPEGGAIPEDTPLQAYSTTYTSSGTKSLMPVTYELSFWAKTNDVTNAATLQGKQVARQIDADGASVFNNGFNTANTSYSDGKPLFSTIHPRADAGASQSNASSTGLVLSEANIETLQLLLERVLDDRGMPVMTFADQLLVPQALRKKAIIFTQTEGRPTTTDNDVNVYNNSIVTYKGAALSKVTTWLNLSNYAGQGAGSDTAWFLLDSGRHMITWLWGEKPRIAERDDSIGFKTDEILWKVRYQASRGWDNWRGAVGSKGDGAAYSS